MAEDLRDGFRGYRDPLELVDRTDIDYAERLALLQEWLAALAQSDAPKEAVDEVQSAINALEMGSEVQSDTPAEAPDAHGYGVPDDA